MGKDLGWVRNFVWELKENSGFRKNNLSKCKSKNKPRFRNGFLKLLGFNVFAKKTIYFNQIIK